MKLQWTTLALILAGMTMAPFAFSQEEVKSTTETKSVAKSRTITNGAVSVDKIGEKIRAYNGGSPQADEIARMSQAGVEEKTILGYIDSLPAMRVKADDIIYLHEKGIPNTIISSWVQHAATASAAAQAQIAAASASAAQPQNAPAQTASVAPTAPTPVYVEQSPPVYVNSPSVVYTVPSYYGYSYPYYYGGYRGYYGYGGYSGYRCYSPYYYNRPYLSIGFSTGFGSGLHTYSHVGSVSHGGHVSHGGMHHH
jgi:hypothetical protein